MGGGGCNLSVPYTDGLGRRLLNSKTLLGPTLWRCPFPTWLDCYSPCRPGHTLARCKACAARGAYHVLALETGGFMPVPHVAPCTLHATVLRWASLAWVTGRTDHWRWSSCAVLVKRVAHARRTQSASESTTARNLGATQGGNEQVGD